MTPAQILAELRAPAADLPEDAILAAMEAPQEVIPGLVEILQEALADPTGFMDEPNHASHLFALFLLAQFREPQALPPLTAMLRLAPEEQDELLGDLITEGMGSLLASLCAAEPAPLVALVTDPDLDLFARQAAMDALLTLGLQGQLSGARLEAILEELLGIFEARGQEEDPMVWAHLASTVAIAGFTDLLPRLRDAYAKGLVDASMLSQEALEERFTTHTAHNRRRFQKDHHLIEDALLELEDRAWLFMPEDLEDEEAFDEDEAYEEEDNEEDEGEPIAIPDPSPETLQAVLARQGHHRPDPAAPSRNAPCPCGSGKKYKRCCGKG